MSLDIITREENIAQHKTWQAKWKRWQQRGCKGSEPQFYPREGYTVVYDTPDENGHWGRRLEACFAVRGDTPQEERSAHDVVRAKFAETMGNRPHTIYQIDR